MDRIIDLSEYVRFSDTKMAFVCDIGFCEKESPKPSNALPNRWRGERVTTTRGPAVEVKTQNSDHRCVYTEGYLVDADSLFYIHRSSAEPGWPKSWDVNK